MVSPIFRIVCHYFKGSIPFIPTIIPNSFWYQLIALKNIYPLILKTCNFCELSFCPKKGFKKKFLLYPRDFLYRLKRLHRCLFFRQNISYFVLRRSFKNIKALESNMLHNLPFSQAEYSEISYSSSNLY